MNYIIIGATGFIGTHLVKLIKSTNPNANVYNLDVIEPTNVGSALVEGIASWATVKNYKSALCNGESHQAQWIYCDVCKPIEVPFEVSSDDVIFNFAAIHRTPGHPDKYYFETNVRGAENVCAFAEKHGIKKIVFTSSIAPYGAAEELKCEDTLPTPNTAYGISKLVAEKIHMMWKAKSPDRQLTIVRPGVVFGKGENGNFTRLYWGIRKHTFAYPGRKDTIKACIYVKELVRFMLWRLDNYHNDGAPESDIFNCTFEPAYTIEKIVESMKKVTSMTTWVPYVPNCVIMPIASIAKLFGSPMGVCPARVKKLQISTNISGKKLKDSGYQFKWTFEEALQDWFEDNNKRCLE
ncbi:MAG: NAD(P)-dependent oxidoreductase [Bacteroidia bacterium]|nr:NAD(P)-dependent oxidoreductase [Bacteroidia bacterium]